jgi:hypothetical protein
MANKRILVWSENEPLQGRWLEYFCEQMPELKDKFTKAQPIKEVSTNAEVEYSPLTTNSPNSLYIYLIKN